MESSLRVLMMPDYRAGNPYQSLLAAGLAKSDVTVIFPTGYRRVFPIWRAVLQGKAPVLHLHWLSPYLRGNNAVSQLLYAGKLWLDLCLVRGCGVRVVWTIHNAVSHEARCPGIERFVQNRVSRLAYRVIVHSHSALRGMIGAKMALNPGRVVVIPHGHYLDAYSAPVPAPEARQALELQNDKFLFLNFGLVRPYKNIEGLIEAWKTLPELAARATLVIAGNATDPAYGKHIANLASGIPGVELRLARVPDCQVHLYFSAADVFVVPFTRILTSGSLLLAITFLLPVIAPRLELTEENLAGADDLLYDKNDRDGLRNALEFAASPQADLAGIRKGMEGFSATLNWDRIARLTADVYRS